LTSFEVQSSVATIEEDSVDENYLGKAVAIDIAHFEVVLEWGSRNRSKAPSAKVAEDAPGSDQIEVAIQIDVDRHDASRRRGLEYDPGREGTVPFPVADSHATRLVVSGSQIQRSVAVQINHNAVAKCAAKTNPGGLPNGKGWSELTSVRNEVSITVGGLTTDDFLKIFHAVGVAVGATTRIRRDTEARDEKDASQPETRTNPPKQPRAPSGLRSAPARPTHGVLSPFSSPPNQRQARRNEDNPRVFPPQLR